MEGDSAQSDARGAPNDAQDVAHDPAGTDVQEPADCLPAVARPAISGQSSAPTGQPLGADLARVVEAWPTLTEPIRRAVLAIVEADAG